MMCVYHYYVNSETTRLEECRNSEGHNDQLVHRGLRYSYTRTGVPLCSYIKTTSSLVEAFNPQTVKCGSI